MSDRDLHAATADPTLSPEERGAVLAEIDRRKAVDTVARDDVADKRTANRVVLVGLDVPFGDLVGILVRLALAAIPAMIILTAIGVACFLLVAAFFAHR